MHRKQVISILLAISVIVGIIPFITWASGNNTLVQTDGCAYTLISDDSTMNPNTNTDMPQFGTKEANGRVWTDKSVAVGDDGFEVTLSALAQEYLTYSGTQYVSSQAVDIVFILDLTDSMDESFDGKRKITCLCQAVNEGIEIIMNSNPKNRVLVVGYSMKDRNPKLNTLLPLGRYKNDTWTDDDLFDYTITYLSGYNNGYYAGKYLSFGKSYVETQGGNIYHKYMLTSSGVQKQDMATNTYSSFSQVKVEMFDSTDLQDGIIYGAQELVSAIENSTYDEDRAPFVTFLTDGVPGSALASQCFSNTPKTSGVATHLTDGSAEYAAYTILSAAYQKDQIKAAYDSYNKKHTGKNAFEVQWFNIGIKSGGKKYAEQVINPSLVANSSKSVNTEIKGYITSTATGSYSKYATEFVFCNEGYYSYPSTASTLVSKINEIADVISEFSKERLVPITNIDGSSASTEIILHDTLGKNMKVSDFSLTLENIDYESIPNTDKSEYSFNELDTKVYVSTNKFGEKEIEWHIPGSEIDMYFITNKRELESNPNATMQYGVSSPSKLKYKVKIASGTAETPLYAGKISSESLCAYAEFTVPYENPYYFDVVYDYDAEPVEFKSSTVKDFDAMALRDNCTKTANVTDTSTYVYENSYSESTYVDSNSVTRSSCKIINKLGNNGVADFTGIRVTKTADRSQVLINGEITYYIKVENLSNWVHSKISLNDIIPNETTYMDGTATKDKTNATIAVNGKTVSMEIPSLNSKENTMFSYKVKVTNAEIGDIIPSSIPRIEKIDDNEVKDDNEENEPGPKIEVVDKVCISIIYSWTGAPTAASLPANKTDGVENENIVVDNKYLMGSKIIENNKKYVFGGWVLTGEKTGNSYNTTGKLSTENVLATGTWISYDKKTIEYSWGTFTPTGYSLPEDIEKYVEETYELEYTVKLGEKIPVYDTENPKVIVGYQEFLGWTDDNKGIVTDSPKSIVASWNYQKADNVIKLMPADGNTSTMIERNGIVETAGTTDISKPYGVTSIITAYDDKYQNSTEYNVTSNEKYEEWFVYGINTTSALTVGTLSQVVKISGDGYWKLYDSQGTEITNMPSKRFGTKCKIEVYDTKTNTLVESFRIVYYGDIDSKANVNATDITYFLQELEYRTWSLRTGKAFVPCLTRAACLSQKKNFSSGDVSMIYAVVVDHAMVIDQRTGLAVKKK